MKCEQFFLPKVDCILSIAESEYELLVKEYHIEPHKIIVVGRTVTDCFCIRRTFPQEIWDKRALLITMQWIYRALSGG